MLRSRGKRNAKRKRKSKRKPRTATLKTILSQWLGKDILPNYAGSTKVQVVTVVDHSSYITHSNTKENVYRSKTGWLWRVGNLISYFVTGVVGNGEVHNPEKGPYCQGRR
jgi:hypothetical protein